MLMMGLFVAPTTARLTDPEPRFDLEPEFVETFDNPIAPGWELSGGAVVEDGVLHLEPVGAQASHEGAWYNCTFEFRVHRSGPGTIGITFTTTGQDRIRIVLGDELIEARRVRSGLTVDMIVERPVSSPLEIPADKWFTLQITRLDTLIVIGIDDARLYDLYDPNPEPLLASGLKLSSVGDAPVEVGRVAVIPWVIEDFEGSLSSAWELSAGNTTPFVDGGTLTVPTGGFAVRKGNWENMTFYTRLRRDGLTSAILTYPGHILEIHHNFIVLTRETQEQMQKLAEAFLPELPPEPEAASWMDIMVVVRDGVHHVLAYGIELFSVQDEVIGGAVTAEAFENEFVLDRLMIGPPLPLWPAGNQSGGVEPGDGEPDGGGSGGSGSGGSEPDGGGPSVLSVDLAVTDLYPDHAPIGRLYLRITNYGPDALQGAPVTVTCGGTATNVTTGAVTQIPDASQGTFSITLVPGQTQAFPTSINLDLKNFNYDLHCTVNAALGSGVFTDPDPGNNTYAEEITAVAPSAPTADLAVTDIFPDNLPQGEIYCRITNNGPDAVQNANVQLKTDVIDFTDPHFLLVYGHTISLNVTLQPGQTSEFDTSLSVDTTNNRRYSISCEITSSLLDPNPGNNLYLESIFPLNQAQLIQADLAVTDIFPDNLPQGDVYCRITNHGPDALQNASVQLVTLVTYHAIPPNPSLTATSPITSITVTLQPGETGVFSTGITVDTTKYWFEITCQIALPLLDPDSSNDSYAEQIGTPQAQILQADLAVTDIFPDNLPNGNIFCRITNNGPDALQNTTVDLVTHRTDNPGPQETYAGYIAKQLTITLQAGETGIFDTDWDVITSLYPIEFVCDVTLPLLDPDTSNNSYSEIVNTSP